jgi:hypothetical protein
MKKRPKKTSREQVIDDLLRTDSNFRALKEAIERRGGKAPMTEADSVELTRQLEARIADYERRREAS